LSKKRNYRVFLTDIKFWQKACIRSFQAGRTSAWLVLYHPDYGDLVISLTALIPMGPPSAC
jgi:hypothetical protein